MVGAQPRAGFNASALPATGNAVAEGSAEGFTSPASWRGAAAMAAEVKSWSPARPGKSPMVVSIVISKCKEYGLQDAAKYSGDHRFDRLKTS